MQHLEVVVFDLAQQGAVDAGHHQPRLLRAAVRRGQQGQGLVVQAVRTLGLKAHEGGEALGIHTVEDFVRLDVELLQLAHRQVDAPAPGVFAHVADDVGELQRLAQGVGVVGGLLLRLAEDARRHFAHDAGHEVAVALQVGVIEVTGLMQVHLAAFDHRLQMALFDAEFATEVHDGLHDRMARVACISLGHFGLPPGQLGLGHACIHHVVDYIVHFAAEGVKGRDGGALALGQEEKGVVKAAAGGGGLVLNVLRGGHGCIVTSTSPAIASPAHPTSARWGAVAVWRSSGRRSCPGCAGRLARPGAAPNPRALGSGAPVPRQIA